MASPPNLGMGLLWTLWGTGASTALSHAEMRLLKGTQTRDRLKPRRPSPHKSNIFSNNCSLPAVTPALES
jgi:hypothetical protein